MRSVINSWIRPGSAHGHPVVKVKVKVFYTTAAGAPIRISFKVAASCAGNHDGITFITGGGEKHHGVKEIAGLCGKISVSISDPNSIRN